MTNEELIAKIKAEIERLYDGEAPKHDQQCDFDDGYFTGIDAISKFLDTLESEKPMNLEEEINRTYHDGSVADTSDLDHNSYENIARHFAEWQKEQDDRLVDIIYQQGIEKGKDEMRETLKREKKK